MYKSLGSYDFCHPEDKQWQVSISVEGVCRVYDTFPEDDEPDLEFPSEVAKLLLDHFKKYLFCTRRDDSVKNLNWIIDNGEELDRIWAIQKVEMLTNKISTIKDEIDDLIWNKIWTEDDYV